MGRIYYHTDGTPSPYPTSLNEGKTRKTPKYDDLELCSNCKICSIKYTVNQRCIHCARLDALAFYNTVVHRAPWPSDAPVIDDIKHALQVLPEHPPVPASPDAAVAANATAWVRPEPCDKEGHIGLRTVNGDCWFCLSQRNTPSPRQVALLNGETWYRPAKACPQCNEHALRNVHNGRCSGCRPLTRRPAGEGLQSPPRERKQSIAAQLMADAPDLVISRTDARTAGLPVYRTGKACKRGHTGFRYVSTGACVDCMADRQQGGGS